MPPRAPEDHGGWSNPGSDGSLAWIPLIAAMYLVAVWVYEMVSAVNQVGHIFRGF